MWRLVIRAGKSTQGFPLSHVLFNVNTSRITGDTSCVAHAELSSIYTHCYENPTLL
uniref:Uncharacterized protein n=1 Tax=Arion vulgaris TaxID=1028688 RepID=A0A0B7ANY0_9EUPU